MRAMRMTGPNVRDVGASLFETDRLAVRPKSLADAEAFHAVYADEAVMCPLGGPFATLEQTRGFVAAHIRHQERHGFSLWALGERGPGAVVGGRGFLAGDRGDR